MFKSIQFLINIKKASKGECFTFTLTFTFTFTRYTNCISGKEKAFNPILFLSV